MHLEIRVNHRNEVESPGARFSRAPETFKARETIAKSRTLRLQSCFSHIFFIWREVPFIQEVSGGHTSPSLRGFQKTGPSLVFHNAFCILNCENNLCLWFNMFTVNYYLGFFWITGIKSSLHTLICLGCLLLRVQARVLCFWAAILHQGIILNFIRVLRAFVPTAHRLRIKNGKKWAKTNVYHSATPNKFRGKWLKSQGVPLKPAVFP